MSKRLLDKSQIAHAYHNNVGHNSLAYLSSLRDGIGIYLYTHYGISEGLEVSFAVKIDEDQEKPEPEIMMPKNIIDFLKMALKVQMIYTLKDTDISVSECELRELTVAA